MQNDKQPLPNLQNDRQKINSFQLLRGLAAIAVILNHFAFFNTFSFGECGVEFFIILSGLLTAMNARKAKKLRNSYFFDKVFKIMPLYWAATILLFLTGLLLPNMFSSLTFSIPNLCYSLFLIPGHTFYIYPGWTLTYFFLFYLLYFISDKISKNRDVCVTIIIISIVFLGFLLRQICGSNIVSNYCNPIMLEFVYGVWLLRLIEKKKMPEQFKWLSFVICVFLFFNFKNYLGPRFFAPAFLSCFVILFFKDAKIETTNFLGKTLLMVGNISFVTYIIHPLIVSPIDKILIGFLGSWEKPLYFLGVLFGCVICILICRCIFPLFKKVRLI